MYRDVLGKEKKFWVSQENIVELENVANAVETQKELAIFVKGVIETYKNRQKILKEQSMEMGEQDTKNCIAISLYVPYSIENILKDSKNVYHSLSDFFEQF